MTICKLDPSDIVNAYLTQLNGVVGKELREQLTVSQLHAIQHLVAATANNVIQGAQLEYAYIVTADCDDDTRPGAEDLHYVLHSHEEAVQAFSDLCRGAGDDVMPAGEDRFCDAYDRAMDTLAGDWLGGEVRVRGGGVTVTIERTEVHS